MRPASVAFTKLVEWPSPDSNHVDHRIRTGPVFEEIGDMAHDWRSVCDRVTIQLSQRRLLSSRKDSFITKVTAGNVCTNCVNHWRRSLLITPFPPRPATLLRSLDPVPVPVEDFDPLLPASIRSFDPSEGDDAVFAGF